MPPLACSFVYPILVIILHNGIYKAAFPTECCACSFVFEFMGGIFRSVLNKRKCDSDKFEICLVVYYLCRR